MCANLSGIELAGLTYPCSLYPQHNMRRSSDAAHGVVDTHVCNKGSKSHSLHYYTPLMFMGLTWEIVGKLWVLREAGGGRCDGKNTLILGGHIAVHNSLPIEH